jgi:hypothetical protein
MVCRRYEGALMPWCDDCSKYWTYSSLNPDGSCPKCGRVVATPERPVNSDTIDLHEMAGDKAKVPWHFKLMVVALAIYLTYRFVQIIVWIA